MVYVYVYRLLAAHPLLMYDPMWQKQLVFLSCIRGSKLKEREKEMRQERETKHVALQHMRRNHPNEALKRASLNEITKLQHCILYFV